MRRLFSIPFLFAAACWTVGAATTPAIAGMSVSPLKQEITVKPGETAKVTVTVSNNDREKLGTIETVQVERVDVAAAEDGGLAFPPPGSLDTSVGKWMTLSATSGPIKPNESLKVECTIAPPVSAAPGEYYAALLITMDTPQKTETGVTVRCRVASGIFVTIPGRTFPKQAKIERVELLWPDVEAARKAAQSHSAAEDAPAVELPKVSVLLRNTGRARFDAEGRIRIQDAKLRQVFSAPLITKRAGVFGGDKRLFEAAITKPLPAGKYTIKAELDYESSWGKARFQIPIEIHPEQAAALTQMTQKFQAGQAPIEVGPEKVTLALPPGATRSLKVAVRNVSDGVLRGKATVAASQAGEWIDVAPASFAIGKAGRRTVAVQVQVPAGVAGGTYASAVILKVGSEGSPLLERVVPVEIEVQAER